MPQPSQKFTSSLFFRSHSRRPRGFGSWAFQQSSTVVAYEDDLCGEMHFVHGANFVQAKAEAKAFFALPDNRLPHCPFLAVLP